VYEQDIITDGDLPFGIEGTFQICDTIYVLTDEADEALLARLSSLGYRLEENTEGYTAKVSHIRTPTEIFDEAFTSVGSPTTNASSYIISQIYQGANRISLSHPDLHNVVISAASQRRDIGYYNRPDDRMPDIAVARMSGFVRHVVDVSYDEWMEFIDEAKHYHAQDFIRRLAHWASEKSDKQPREVRVNSSGSTQIILGAKPFNLTKSQPIKYGFITPLPPKNF
jgi:hypothetical protein